MRRPPLQTQPHHFQLTVKELEDLRATGVPDRLKPLFDGAGGVDSYGKTRALINMTKMFRVQADYRQAQIDDLETERKLAAAHGDDTELARLRRERDDAVQQAHQAATGEAAIRREYERAIAAGMAVPVSAGSDD